MEGGGEAALKGPAPSEPAPSEPAQPEPAQPEPAQPEPAQSEPAKSEPSSPVQDPVPESDPEDLSVATLDPYLYPFIGDEDDTSMDISIEDMQVFLGPHGGDKSLDASSLPDMKEA